jgi:hypothetical protein
MVSCLKAMNIFMGDESIFLDSTFHKFYLRDYFPENWYADTLRFRMVIERNISIPNSRTYRAEEMYPGIKNHNSMQDVFFNNKYLPIKSI